MSPEKKTALGKLGEAIALVYYTHWILQAVATTLPIAISYLTQHRVTRLGITGSVLVTLGSAIFWHQRLKHLYALRKTFANPYLEFITYEVILRFDDPRQEVVASYKLTFKATRNEVSSFVKKQNWPNVRDIIAVPGDGVEDIGHVTEHTDRLWSFFRVYFKQISKGQVHTVRFEVRAKDPDQLALPHIGFLVDDNITGQLILRAVSIYRKIETAQGLILDSMRSELPERKQDLTVDELTGEVRWEKKRPKPGKVYRIQWSFAANHAHEESCDNGVLSLPVPRQNTIRVQQGPNS